MELDFKSVKALSSPTRVKILRKLMEGKSTTTRLSEDLDKSKSTISSHLKELTEAGLLEKDEKEGRRRVEYRATRKVEAIVKGKERKVKFSIASSAFTALGGALLVWKDRKQDRESPTGL
ncbi:MAG: ArsR/SmtB family transcription factor [Candidatus Nanohalobium sp.]